MNEFAIPPFVMAGISLYLALTHFIYFLILPRKNRRLYLLFALVALATAFYDIMEGRLYLATSFDEGISLQLAQFLAICPVTISIFLLVFEFLELIWKPWHYFIISVLSVMSIVGFLFPSSVFVAWLST